jgi:hypothetical protein
MKKDIDRFTAMPPGTAVDEIIYIPPLNLAANDAAALFT